MSYPPIDSPVHDHLLSPPQPARDVYLRYRFPPGAGVEPVAIELNSLARFGDMTAATRALLLDLAGQLRVYQFPTVLK